MFLCSISLGIILDEFSRCLLLQNPDPFPHLLDSGDLWSLFHCWRVSGLEVDGLGSWPEQREIEGTHFDPVLPDAIHSDLLVELVYLLLVGETRCFRRLRQLHRFALHLFPRSSWLLIIKSQKTLHLPDHFFPKLIHTPFFLNLLPSLPLLVLFLVLVELKPLFRDFLETRSHAALLFPLDQDISVVILVDYSKLLYAQDELLECEILSIGGYLLEQHDNSGFGYNLPGLYLLRHHCYCQLEVLEEHEEPIDSHVHLLILQPLEGHILPYPENMCAVMPEDFLQVMYSINVQRGGILPLTHLISLFPLPQILVGVLNLSFLGISKNAIWLPFLSTLSRQPLFRLIKARRLFLPIVFSLGFFPRASFGATGSGLLLLLVPFGMERVVERTPLLAPL